jgi:hypothetical protein
VKSEQINQGLRGRCGEIYFYFARERKAFKGGKEKVRNEWSKCRFGWLKHLE